MNKFKVPIDKPRLVTMGELVKLIGVSRQSIYGMINRGLPVYQDARDVLFDAGAVSDYLREFRLHRGSSVQFDIDGAIERLGKNEL